MSVFVIGASGYIGSSLFEHAKKLSFAFGTSSTGSDGLIKLGLDDLNKFDFNRIQLDDVVFLTAAISAPDVCANEHERAWAVNVTGTSAFISRVMEKGGRIVFFSSDTVYGEAAYEFDEQAACNPAGEYAVMKHEVEKQFLGNPLFKSVRLSYVFSRDDKFTAYLAGCIERDEEADIFHPFLRAVIHRDDVVSAAMSLAEQWDRFPQGVINFGGPEVLARTEFAGILQHDALPELRFRVTEPDDAFFRKRPRVIRMVSPVLPSLLGRTARTLREAAKIEFNLNTG